MKTERLIERLRDELGLPYIDVYCKRGYDQLLRYTSGDGCTGRERLFMFSCGKVAVVSLGLRLIEENRMSLDDRVADYLPEIANAFVMEEGEKHRVGDKMTVRHLFTMTAGFSYDVTTTPITSLQARKPDGTLRDFISAFVEYPLSFQPGKKYQYSLCHDVLAAVIEVASGKKFSEYAADTLFRPLEMADSNFCNDTEGVARLYVADVDGTIREIERKNHLSLGQRYESGGAGLVSSVEDYMKFAQTLAMGGVGENGYRLLSEQSVKALRTCAVDRADTDCGFTCVQGDEYGYGLGVRVRTVPTPFGLGVGEFGWDGAAGSYLMIDPERRVSVFIGMHTRGWPNIFKNKHLEIVESIYKEYL